MQIQVNTDNHIAGGDAFSRHVETVIMDAVDQFRERITRVEVHLSDRNSGEKSGSNDKRCVLEARLGGMQPVTVSDDGESIQQALDGAADKLQKLLGRSLERLGNRKGRTSYSGDDMTLPEPDLA